MPQFKKGKIVCPVCNGSHSLKEVLEAKNDDLDSRLCRKHLAALFKKLTGRDIVPI